jgi:hypothetical protein
MLIPVARLFAGVIKVEYSRSIASYCPCVSSILRGVNTILFLVVVGVG